MRTEQNRTERKGRETKEGRDEKREGGRKVKKNKEKLRILLRV